jgi:poly(A) polymerase
VTKVTGDWLSDPALQGLLRVIEAGGHRALLVGGCVRNALLGQPVADVDIATDAMPLRVTELATGAGLRVVPTGIDHGTVTVVAGGRGHEVTTFRRDVAADGRRAVVAFSDDVTEDARRRDFTINALYADRTGRVFDPLGGLPDLSARRVRFVGDAEERIREDYLRILRFFRFHAWYADPAGGFGPEALAACAVLSAGIDTLSRERVGGEMLRLLAAPDPAPSIAAMQTAGVLARVLPGVDARALPILVHLEDGADALARLATLGGTDAAGALRLSRADRDRLHTLRDAATGGAGAGEIAYRSGLEAARAAGRIRAALLEQPLPPGWDDAAALGANATLPVSAADFMPALQGRALGARLARAEHDWITSGFRLTRADLID